VRVLKKVYPDSAAVSAKEGHGLDDLIQLITGKLRNVQEEPTLLKIPLERGDAVAELYRDAHILKRREADGHWELTVRLPPHLTRKFSAFISP